MNCVSGLEDPGADPLAVKELEWECTEGCTDEENNLHENGLATINPDANNEVTQYLVLEIPNNMMDGD